MTREEAIKYIKSRCIGSTEERDGTQWSEAMWTAIEALVDRPTGEWVEKDGETVCSLCGNSVSFSQTKDGWVLGKFCQTCGARMKGGVE